MQLRVKNGDTDVVCRRTAPRLVGYAAYDEAHRAVGPRADAAFKRPELRPVVYADGEERRLASSAERRARVADVQREARLELDDAAFDGRQDLDPRERGPFLSPPVIAAHAVGERRRPGLM